MGVHFYDCYEFLTEGLSDNVLVWQGYPYSVLWYAFFFVALQVKSPRWVVIPICTYLAAAALDAEQMQNSFELSKSLLIFYFGMAAVFALPGLLNPENMLTFKQCAIM